MKFLPTAKLGRFFYTTIISMSARLRTLFITLATSSLLAALAAAWSSCATIPEPKYDKFTFPKNAFVGDTSRPYVTLGPVRSKVDCVSLDSQREEKDLCRNYYNKAVKDLLKFAKRQGADAVIDVKSIVFLEDGRRETYKTPECSDDGGEGQVLAQGIAVKWQGSGGPELGSWTQPSPSPTPEWVAPIPSAPLPIEAAAAALEREPVAEASLRPEPAVTVKMQSIAEAEQPPESIPAPAPQLPQRINLADPRGIPGRMR